MSGEWFSDRFDALSFCQGVIFHSSAWRAMNLKEATHAVKLLQHIKDLSAANEKTLVRVNLLLYLKKRSGGSRKNNIQYHHHYQFFNPRWSVCRSATDDTDKQSTFITFMNNTLMLYSHLQHHNDTIIKQTQIQRRKKKGRRNEGRRKTSL